MDIDPGRLEAELQAVGLNIAGCDTSGGISFLSLDEGNVAPLVLAAHGQALASAECQALQTAVTPAQWMAYQQPRKSTIKRRRIEQYQAETDPMRMSLDEDFTIGSDAWNAALAAWKAAKDAIRVSLPYPE